MNFEAVRALADAVMMEGYALYPYRASAPKNRFRWTFGVLAPREWSEADGSEAWWLEARLLVAGKPDRVAGRLRFFQIARRRGDDWTEGVIRSVDFELPEGACERAFEIEDASDAGREARRLSGRLWLEREDVAAERPLQRVTIRVENTTPFGDRDAPRERALLGALASTHVIVGVDGGELLSAIDPPPWARTAAGSCRSTRTFPVLAGRPGLHDLALCAPFILADHPRLAPESAGDLCDATEIDELLLLRTRTLTDEEKRQARATDARVAEIVDRADALADARLLHLHGARRDVRAGEMAPRPAIGSKVRLRAATRTTDAQDALYAGHVATVAEVKEDVDGTTFLAVTIDDDPAAELCEWYGRYRYYRLDEVEPL